MRRMMRARAITEHTTIAAISPGCKPDSTQLSPSPAYPVEQTHWKVPGMLSHLAFTSQSFEAVSEHSSTSAQVFKPSPQNPAPQSQVKLPTVLAHVANGRHGSESHSLISVQVLPSPSYPVAHAQENDPGVLEQTPFAGSQSSVPRAHSSSSTQTRESGLGGPPSPLAGEYPLLQVQV